MYKRVNYLACDYTTSHRIKRGSILHECSDNIEFIEQVGEKRRLDDHLITEFDKFNRSTTIRCNVMIRLLFLLCKFLVVY